LTFQEFQKFYTPKDNAYLKAAYKTIKYPPIARENMLEGVIRVQLINHSKDNLEIIVSGLTHEFLLEKTRKKIALVNTENCLKSDHQYITSFYIEYDLEPFNLESKCSDMTVDCDYIVIQQYAVPLIRK